MIFFLCKSKIKYYDFSDNLKIVVFFKQSEQWNYITYQQVLLTDAFRQKWFLMLKNCFHIPGTFYPYINNIKVIELLQRSFSTLIRELCEYRNNLQFTAYKKLCILWTDQTYLHTDSKK